MLWNSIPPDCVLDLLLHGVKVSDPPRTRLKRSVIHIGNNPYGAGGSGNECHCVSQPRADLGVHGPCAPLWYRIGRTLRTASYAEASNAATCQRPREPVAATVPARISVCVYSCYVIRRP